MALYQTHEVIGRGLRSTVYRGENESTGVVVALKEIYSTSNGMSTADREASMLRTLASPNVRESSCSTSSATDTKT